MTVAMNNPTLLKSNQLLVLLLIHRCCVLWSTIVFFSLVKIFHNSTQYTTVRTHWSLFLARKGSSCGSFRTNGSNRSWVSSCWTRARTRFIEGVGCWSKIWPQTWLKLSFNPINKLISGWTPPQLKVRIGLYSPSSFFPNPLNLGEISAHRERSLSASNEFTPELKNWGPLLRWKRSRDLS